MRSYAETFIAVQALNLLGNQLQESLKASNRHQWTPVHREQV